MNEAQRISRAHQAETSLKEFIQPMLDEMRNVYSDRIVEHATTELDPRKRSDKITALSHALKILDTVEAGMAEIIRDGKIAAEGVARAEKVEKMTAPQRRLLGIGPY